MRTTIRLDDQLLAEAKQLAAQTGRTLTAVIEDALREVLARRKQAPKAERVQLLRHGMGGLQPGVNLDDNAAVRDLMDGIDAAD
ncbi:MAG: YlcI/YnfO family protein [Planctomycetota bacterium]|jgi:hypothetical protein